MAKFTVVRKFIDKTTGNLTKILVSSEKMPYMLTVEFDVNGGRSVEYTHRKYPLFGSFDSLPSASHSSLTFNGWFDAATAGNQIQVGDTVELKDGKLYAQWSQGVPYTTLYYSNGTSSAFSVSTMTWSEVGKASSTASNTSVIQAIGGTNCTSIGTYAFYNCTSLTTASFPACTTIGESAFFGCSNLMTTNFSICTMISSHAFYSCSNLTTASFPACQTINGWAFGLCFRLTTASFPSCQMIGESVFVACRNLSSIALPNTITTISINAFATESRISIYTTSQDVAELVKNSGSRAFGSSGHIYLNGSLYSTIGTSLESE